MSRTDLDAATLANSLRAMAGDGSIEWVCEPIQSSVLLDIADMLNENAKLRDGRERLFRANVDKNREVLRLLDENARLKQELESVGTAAYLYGRTDFADENAKLRELTKGLSWCSEERYLGHQESECPLYDERADGKCRAEALMKELGIEVEE